MCLLDNEDRLKFFNHVGESLLVEGVCGVFNVVGISVTDDARYKW